MDQLALFLRSGAPVPPEFAQALQMMSRGQQPASQPSRSPLQAPSPTSSPSHATAGAPRPADSTRSGHLLNLEITRPLMWGVTLFQNIGLLC